MLTREEITQKGMELRKGREGWIDRYCKLVDWAIADVEKPLRDEIARLKSELIVSEADLAKSKKLLAADLIDLIRKPGREEAKQSQPVQDIRSVIESEAAKQQPCMTREEIAETFAVEFDKLDQFRNSAAIRGPRPVEPDHYGWEWAMHAALDTLAGRIPKQESAKQQQPVEGELLDVVRDALQDDSYETLTEQAADLIALIRKPVRILTDEELSEQFRKPWSNEIAVARWAIAETWQISDLESKLAEKPCGPTAQEVWNKTKRLGDAVNERDFIAWFTSRVCPVAEVEAKLGALYRDTCEEKDTEIIRLKSELKAADEFRLSLDPCPHCWGMPSAENEPCTCNTGARLTSAEEEVVRLQEQVDDLRTLRGCDSRKIAELKRRSHEHP